MGHKSIWKSDLKEQPKGQEKNISSMQFTSDHKRENSFRQLAWPNSMYHSRLHDVTQKPPWQCHCYWNPRESVEAWDWGCCAAVEMLVTMVLQRHHDLLQTEDLATPGLANRLRQCAAECNRGQCYPVYPLHKSCDILKYIQVIGHEMN